MAVQDIVTVVNRTSRAVESTFDGRVSVIPAHGEKPMLVQQAELAKRQNPVMGTEDPFNPYAGTYLLGVKEWGDDITPIEQSACEERFDRDLLTMPGAQKAEVIHLGGGVARRAEIVDAKLNLNPTGMPLSHDDAV